MISGRIARRVGRRRPKYRIDERQIWHNNHSHPKRGRDRRHNGHALMIPNAGSSLQARLEKEGLR